MASANDWTVGLDFMTFQPISSPQFYGGDRVDYVDTFFVFNQPNTDLLSISPRSVRPNRPHPYDLNFTLELAGRQGGP